MLSYRASLSLPWAIAIYSLHWSTLTLWQSPWLACADGILSTSRCQDFRGQIEEQCTYYIAGHNDA